MQQLNDLEQKNIIGGAFKISASMVNGIVKGVTFLLELGRSLGTAIRRFQTKTWC